MADGRNNQPLSLNQRHHRYLVDLSASQFKHRSGTVDADAMGFDDAPRFDLDSPREDDDTTRLNAMMGKSFDDAPRFDFDSPSPLQGKEKVNVEEPVSKLKGSSPRLFTGIADSDSPSYTCASETHESSQTTEEDDSSSEMDPTISDPCEYNTNIPVDVELEPTDLLGSSVTADKKQSSIAGDADFDSSFPGEERQTKIKLKGRRRLCKMGQNRDNDAGAGENFMGNEEPKFDGISDTNIPVDVELEPTDLLGSSVTADKKQSSIAGDADFDSSFPGEERQTKIKIKGRRRLCKMGQNRDIDAGAGENFMGNEEPKFDGISDFNSPLPASKPSESNGNEIRDILNDLSSRLEILSIEKTRVPKKIDLKEDFQKSARSKLYDVTNQASSSSNMFSSNSQVERIESKVRGIVTNKQPHENIYNGDTKGDNYAGKANKTMSKREGRNYNDPMTVRPVKHSQAYNQRRDEDKYLTLSETHSVRNVGRKEEKFSEVSDEEPDDVKILDDEVDDFTLSGKGTYKLPGKIAKMLYPHQRDGLKWLWSLHCKGKGGILGDDMGLGKTMQICSFVAGLFHSNLVRRVLVVAPKTLLAHWINELSTVGLSEKTREYFATCTKTRHYELQRVLKDKGILLTTYDIVRNNTKSLCGDYCYNDDGDEDEMTWDYMILDEGHLIKNPSTQRAKSLLQIPCVHRIIISGTPLQNNLKELWALFSFCCPELLGDKKDFKDKYEHYINRGNEKNASDREKRTGSSVAKDLRDVIQPYFLRRMKSEVFRDDNTLSKKDEIIVWLRLTQCQRQLYEAFLKSEIVVSACDGSPLAAITILKKICDHPLLLTKRAAEDVLEGMDSIAGQEDHRVAEKLAMHIADVADRFDIVDNQDMSCKISFIMSLLADLIPKGHNVLIFSQTRKMLNLIQESLVSNHYKYMRIDGTTKITDRAKLVKDFQEGRGASIFLLTSQVGGLGITLTNADRVIVADPAWNPSTDNQSVDRAYRIGQKKNVIVYRLMTCNTVEEKIYKKQVFKGGLFRSATEHKEQTRYFSQQDLRDLFKLPKDGFDISPTQQQLLEEHDRQHTMEEFLREHVEFLETLNIAGVSHHSLLFSKAAPVKEAVEVEDDPQRPRVSTYMGNASSRSSHEHNVDGAHNAFNPKDIKKVHRNSSPDVKEVSEDEICERINRLTQIFTNKVAISRLPDKGEKIHKQISGLYLQLDELRAVKVNKHDVIEL